MGAFLNQWFNCIEGLLCSCVHRHKGETTDTMMFSFMWDITGDADFEISNNGRHLIIRSDVSIYENTIQISNWILTFIMIVNILQYEWILCADWSFRLRLSLDKIVNQHIQSYIYVQFCQAILTWTSVAFRILFRSSDYRLMKNFLLNVLNANKDHRLIIADLKKVNINIKLAQFIEGVQEMVV